MYHAKGKGRKCRLFDPSLHLQVWVLIALFLEKASVPRALLRRKYFTPPLCLLYQPGGLALVPDNYTSLCAFPYLKFLFSQFEMLFKMIQILDSCYIRTLQSFRRPASPAATWRYVIFHIPGSLILSCETTRYYYYFSWVLSRITFSCTNPSGRPFQGMQIYLPCGMYCRQVYLKSPAIPTFPTRLTSRLFFLLFLRLWLLSTFIVGRILLSKPNYIFPASTGKCEQWWSVYRCGLCRQGFFSLFFTVRVFTFTFLLPCV